MSLFGKILEKLGMKKPEEAAPAAKAAPKAAPAARPVATKPAAKPAASVKPAGSASFATPSSTPAAPAAAPMAMVDVMSKLEKMGAGTGLDWKVSIVDLLKVLGIDSSLQARKELAQELGCPAETMKDNVAMNVWLHKAVLSQIAKNGG
ncbi:MAG: DUF3597 domain-containing protein, partial [Chloroflexota bacterium]